MTPNSNSLSQLPHYKAVLFGDSGVGKTALFQHFAGKGWSECTKTTLGSDLAIQRCSADSDIVLELWDTAGAEQFVSFSNVYLRGCSVVIFVYDAHDWKSLNNVQERWWPVLTPDLQQHALCILVGARVDREGLLVEPKVIASQLGLVLAPQMTSARTGQGVAELFAYIGAQLKARLQAPLGEGTPRPLLREGMQLLVPRGEQDEDKATSTLVAVEQPSCC